MEPFFIGILWLFGGFGEFLSKPGHRTYLLTGLDMEIYLIPLMFRE
jgi:hypothetical protein